MFPRTLADGYRLWRGSHLPEERGRLAQLAALGQAPQALVIGCCDSRVSPETIFSAGLGELFVLRNVANVIPPFRPDGKQHGTSAAIEFALLGLSVPSIVVLGHSQCGGVKAYLNASFDPESRGDFIGPWMDLIEGTKEDAAVARSQAQGPGAGDGGGGGGDPRLDPQSPHLPRSAAARGRGHAQHSRRASRHLERRSARAGREDRGFRTRFEIDRRITSSRKPRSGYPGSLSSPDRVQRSCIA